MALQRVQERISAMRRIENAARGKKRAFMGLKDDEGRLRADFELKADELYIYLTPGGEVPRRGG
ncbi:MAG: hypothetical protein IJU00_00745 [Selenomonas sp.]|nr:hypothetical protein [Selenomonas sp.]